MQLLKTIIALFKRVPEAPTFQLNLVYILTVYSSSNPIGADAASRIVSSLVSNSVLTDLNLGYALPLLHSNRMK